MASWTIRLGGLCLTWLLAGCAGQQLLPTQPAKPSAPAIKTVTPRPSVKYHEVQFLALDGAYLSNPGMGWQQDVKSDHPDVLPETVAYSVRHDIAWLVLNPAEGIYDWSALDAELERAVSQGKQYSFRVQTMSGGTFGGEKVPDWVLRAGATLTASGGPDYSNCTYQEKWAEFVDALIARYDGNLSIAYIDISGYGDFNEWSWGDQTEWDDAWATASITGAYDPADFETLDGQARRRLADMFIGESFSHHACRDKGSQIHYVDYSYAGFQHTQLVMPYGGVRQSSQYVAWRRRDVGFRFDCLGAEDPNRIITLAGDIWRWAPVAFELCPPDRFSMDVARLELMDSHGSLVHDNFSALSTDEAKSLMLGVGYRYVLRSALVPDIAVPGDDLHVTMNWQNVGTAPAYPRMGQDFKLHLYLIGDSGQAALDGLVPTDVSAWMPADIPGGIPPDIPVIVTLHLPAELPAGKYELKAAIVDARTGLPIQLGFDGPDSNGRYLLATVTVGE